jgi:ADP-ribose pyrophosphatase
MLGLAAQTLNVAEPWIHWTRVYALRYCPDCGAPLDPVAGRAERLISQTCSSCDAVHFRNAKPCAGALIVQHGQVLLGRRAVEPARGSWGIPGGFLNPWEHPADGAVREVREETGLEVRLERLLDVVVDTYEDRDYTLNLYWVAEVIAGTERAADDLSELRWFRPNELPTEFAFPHCAQVLQAWQSELR